MKWTTVMLFCVQFARLFCPAISSGGFFFGRQSDPAIFFLAIFFSKLRRDNINFLRFVKTLQASVVKSVVFISGKSRIFSGELRRTTLLKLFFRSVNRSLFLYRKIKCKSCISVSSYYRKGNSSWRSPMFNWQFSIDCALWF